MSYTNKTELPSYNMDNIDSICKAIISVNPNNINNADNLLLISELIKNTQSDDLINNCDQLITIAKFIKTININHSNIHSILKLISNLIKFKFAFLIAK